LSGSVQLSRIRVIDNAYNYST